MKSRWQWLESQGDYTLFQGYELNRLAADWFAQRECPHVIVVESGSGMAIIPAVRRERELGLIGETLFDYRDVLSAGNGEVLEEAWRELAKPGMKLEVTALRGQQTCDRWGSLGPKLFCNAPTTRRCDLSAVEFVAGHKKAAKASRRLARQGLRLLRREHEFDRLAEWVYRRKTEWRGASENLFLDKRRRDFMCHVINSAAVDCILWSYETVDGQIAAVLVTFDHRSVRHFYTIHHDPLWEQFSPGQVMIFDVTRETLTDGMDVDFMTGEYPYKNRLATAMVPLFRIEASARLMNFGERDQVLKPAV
jgi:CelD/BcsL family acetyltransferase involved in cellulose biosynthesis